MRLNDYEACQSLEAEARKAGVELIRYPSARDPDKGTNIALLTPKAFATKKPVHWQTWRIRLSASGISALCDFPLLRLSFGREAFAADARLKDFRWSR